MIIKRLGFRTGIVISPSLTTFATSHGLRLAPRLPPFMSERLRAIDITPDASLRTAPGARVGGTGGAVQRVNYVFKWGIRWN